MDCNKHPSKIPITIFIPTYNCEKYIHQTLTALLQNINGKNYQVSELIVIDSFSVDSTREIIANFIKEVSKKGLEVKFLSTPIKIIGYVRNLGIKCSTNEFILMIDCDTIISRQYIEKLVEEIRKSEYTGIVRGYILYKRHKKISPLMMLLLTLENYARHLFFHAIRRTATNYAHIGGEGILCRKSLILRAGNFNPHLSASEDVELARRLIKMGYKVLILPIIAYEPAKHFESLKKWIYWIASYSLRSKSVSLDSSSIRGFMPILKHMFIQSVKLTIIHRNLFYAYSFLYFLLKNIIAHGVKNAIK